MALTRFLGEEDDGAVYVFGDDEDEQRQIVLPSYLQEAQDLRAQIDQGWQPAYLAGRAQPAGKTAGAGAGPGTRLGDWVSGVGEFIQGGRPSPATPEGQEYLRQQEAAARAEAGAPPAPAAPAAPQMQMQMIEIPEAPEPPKRARIGQEGGAQQRAPQREPSAFEAGTQVAGKVSPYKYVGGQRAMPERVVGKQVVRDAPPVTAQQKKETEDLVQRQRDLAKQRADYEHQQIEVARTNLGIEMQQQDEFITAREEKLAEVTEEVQRRETRLDNMNMELSQSGVNPNRWYASASTGQRFGAALAMIAGGYLAGARGGRNEGAAFIQDIINDDIRAQEVELERKKWQISGEENQLARYIKENGSVEMAKDQLREAHLGLVKLQMADLGMISEHGAVDQDAADVLLAIDQGMVNTRDMWRQRAYGRVTEKVAPAQEARAPVKVRKSAKELAGEAKSRKEIGEAMGFGEGDVSPEQRFREKESARSRLVPDAFGEGKHGYALTGEDAKMAKSARVAKKRAHKAQQDYRELVRDWGVLSAPQRKARITSLRGQMTLILKDAETLGALDQGAVDVAQTVHGEFGTMDLTGADEAALDQYVVGIEGKEDAILETSVSANPEQWKQGAVTGAERVERGAKGARKLERKAAQ